MLQNKATSVVTIERFIIEQERLHPQATGQLSGILYDMALAAKMIANKVRSAGLADILGSAGEENVQGEVQQKLERAGLKNYTNVAETKNGPRIRVRAGPFGSRAEADKAAEKIKGLDLPAAILSL